MVIFGILVPTGDNFSDLWLSMRFFSGTYDQAGVEWNDCVWDRAFTISSTRQTFICDVDDCTLVWYGNMLSILKYTYTNGTSYTCKWGFDGNCTLSRLCDTKLTPYSQPTYGAMTLLPVFLSFVFTRN